MSAVGVGGSYSVGERQVDRPALLLSGPLWPSPEGGQLGVRIIMLIITLLLLLLIIILIIIIISIMIIIITIIIP